LPGSDSAALRAGLEAVMHQAGELARVTSRRVFKRWTKGADHSPVSEADIAVNDLLRTRLTVLAPQAGWLSEETEDSLPGRANNPGTLATAWIVDPIDGTRAFISGFPDWTISVALVEHGRPILAAVYAPVTDEMFLAVRAQGAARNGVAITASGGNTLSGARLAGPKRYLDRLACLDPAILAQPKVHSLALRFARIAQGSLDAAFAAPGSHDWDLAAADLLVHEAGGLLTDSTGQPLLFNRAHVVHDALIAAGPARHASLIELVRNRQAEFA
jgi:myo-inositol-1(or 4)-monophosphatase